MRTLFLFAVLLYGLGNRVIAQEGISISLEHTVTTAPQNYYIKDVRDERPARDIIGRISTGNIKLQDGLETELEKELADISEKDGKLPIQLFIRRFDVTEKQAGTKIQYDLDVILAYYLGDSKLIEYKGSTFTQTRGDAAEAIVKLVAKTLNDNLLEFDNWLGRNRGNISVEPTVEVTVYIDKTAEKPDFIPYNRDTKLRISDFKARPEESSPGAAATLSGVGMSFQSQTMNNKTTVSVQISVYFDRNRSWMKPEGKNNYILEHEQRHFDITAIQGCKLKGMIENGRFSPDNYKAELKELLDKVQEEGANLQNTYDAETEHGVAKEKQAEWNDKIREELSKQLCF